MVNHKKFTRAISDHPKVNEIYKEIVRRSTKIGKERESKIRAVEKETRRKYEELYLNLIEKYEVRL